MAFVSRGDGRCSMSHQHHGHLVVLAMIEEAVSKYQKRQAKHVLGGILKY